jgi:hypothetical protein
MQRAQHRWGACNGAHQVRDGDMLGASAFGQAHREDALTTIVVREGCEGGAGEREAGLDNAPNRLHPKVATLSPLLSFLKPHPLPPLAPAQKQL